MRQLAKAAYVAVVRAAPPTDLCSQRTAKPALLAAPHSGDNVNRCYLDTKSTKNTKITKLADEPAKPLPKLNGVEIQQIPKPKAGEFQVSEQLRLMEARYGFDRFYFHDNSVV